MKNPLLLPALVLGLIAPLCLPPLTAAEDVKKPDPALEKYFSANGFYNQKYYPLAIEEYKDFLKAYPNHEKTLQAQLGLALSTYGAKQYEDAIPLLTKLAANNTTPNREHVELMLAQSHLMLKHPADAETAFQKVLQGRLRKQGLAGLGEALYQQKKWDDLATKGSTWLAEAPNARLRYQTGVAQFELEKYPESEATLKSLADTENGLQPFARFVVAESLRNQDKFPESVAYYTPVADTPEGPFAAEARFFLGVVSFRQSQYDDTIKHLTTLLSTHKETPLAPQGKLYLGRAQLEKKDYASAQKTLTPLGTPESTLWLARTHSRQQQYAKAENVLKPVQTSDSPFTQDLVFDYAQALVAQEKFTDALPAFQHLLKEFADGPRQADALRQYAFCLHRTQKFEDSLTQCEAFLKSHGDDANAHEVAFIQAENHFLKASLDPAIAGYTAFLTTYTDSPRLSLAQFRMAQAQYQQEKWTDVVATLKPLLATQPEGPAFEQLRYMAGASAYQAGDWQNAVTELEAFASSKKDADNADLALLTAALAQEQLDQKPKAITLLATMTQSYPDSTHRDQALAELGRLHYEASKPAEAGKALAGVKAEPHLAKANYYLGFLARDAEKLPEAASAFAKAADATAFDNAAHARLQQGHALQGQSLFPDAQKVWQQFLVDHSDDPRIDEARYHLGLALARQNQWAPAANEFAKITAPEHKPNALYEWAWAEKGRADTNTATTCYARLLKNFPDAPLAPAAGHELAEIEFQNGNFAQAATLAKTAYTKTEDRPLKDKCLYRLGMCLVDQEQALGAARTLEQLLSESPSSDLRGLAAYQAGESRLTLKEYPQAMAHFDTATKASLEGEAAEQALLRLSETQALSGKWTESSANCKTFLTSYASSPLAPRAQFGLGWAEENLTRRPSAIAAYQKVVDLGRKDETSARSQFQIGECHYANKKYDDALKAYMRVTVAYGFDAYKAKALLGMGKSFEAKGETDFARERYAEINTLFPDSDEAKVAQSQLAKLP